MILLLTKSVFPLIGLVLLTVIIHEGAHYGTALMMGVPITFFPWFEPGYFAPAFFVGSEEHTMVML
ncbi:hypothetical protein ACFLTZ_02350 [Chloroflexota bacterium]